MVLTFIKTTKIYLHKIEIINYLKRNFFIFCFFDNKTILTYHLHYRESVYLQKIFFKYLQINQLFFRFFFFFCLSFKQLLISIQTLCWQWNRTKEKQRSFSLILTVRFKICSLSEVHDKFIRVKKTENFIKKRLAGEWTEIKNDATITFPKKAIYKGTLIEYKAFSSLFYEKVKRAFYSIPFLSFDKNKMYNLFILRSIIVIECYMLHVVIAHYSILYIYIYIINI